MGRVEVLHDDERQTAAGRHVPEKLLQGLPCRVPIADVARRLAELGAAFETLRIPEEVFPEIPGSHFLAVKIDGQHQMTPNDLFPLRKGMGKADIRHSIQSAQDAGMVVGRDGGPVGDELEIAHRQAARPAAA